MCTLRIVGSNSLVLCCGAGCASRRSWRRCRRGCATWGRTTPSANCERRLALYMKMADTFMLGRRVRKQKEMEALSQRLYELEQDNASLRGHVDSRNSEILRLCQVIRSMCGGSTPGISTPETSPLPPNALSAHPRVRAAASCLGCNAVYCTAVYSAPCAQVSVKKPCMLLCWHVAPRSPSYPWRHSALMCCQYAMQACNL